MPRNRNGDQPRPRLTETTRIGPPARRDDGSATRNRRRSSDKLNQMADDPSAETNGYRLRTGAIAFGVGLCTNEKCAALLVESLARKFAKPDGSYGVPRHLDEYYAGAF